MADSSNLKNPFPGLRPFENDEYHLFFGRETHVSNVLEKLRSRKFVCVVGNSGSGKSSLVRAGVLPTLRKEKDENWHICTLRPGSNPVQSLFENVFLNSDLTKGKEGLPNDISILKKSTKGLIQAARPFLADGSKLLILADQFEELFRFINENEDSDFEEATHFVNLLLEASAEKSIDIHVMMTIRSDFLGDCEKFYGLPEAINDAQFLVPRLNRKELQRIIEAPIEYAGAKISPRLVQKLLNSIGTQTDLLPILQHLLNRLWSTWVQQNNGNISIPIDIEHYEFIGGIKSAMSNHLEEVIGEFNTEELVLIENIFKTITVKGADNRGVRRPTRLDKIASILEVNTSDLIKIIDAFRLSDRGFIMPPSNVKLNDDTIIDISHESLMRVWSRLMHWVDEEQESLSLYYRLCESAELYNKGKSGLWRDPDLALGLSWLNVKRHTEEWSKLYNNQFADAKQFLRASKENLDFEQADKLRKKRIFQTVLIASSIALSGLTIYAFLQKNSADIATKKAKESSKKAVEQASIAQTEKLNAIKQKSIAEIQKKKAEVQAEIAEKERTNALDQKRNAVKQSEIANYQRLVALNEQKKAEQAKQQTEKALKAANEANKARNIALKQAISSEAKAQQNKNYALSKSVAIKSKLLNPKNESDLKVALSREALDIFKKSKRPYFDRDLHGALLDANLSKKGNDYTTISCHDMESRSALVKENYTISVGLDGKVNVISNDSYKIISQAQLKGIALYKIIDIASQNTIALLGDKNKIYLCKWDHKSGIIQKEGFNKITESTSGIIDMVSVGENLLYLTNNSLERISTTGDILDQIPFDFEATALVRSNNDNNNVYVGSNKGEIYKISISEHTFDKIYTHTKSNPINTLYAHLNELYMGFSDGSCVLFPLIENGINHNFPGHTAGITDIDISSDGNLMATSSFDGIVRVYSLDHKMQSPLEFNQHKSWVYSVSFTGNSNEIFSTGRDRKVNHFKIKLDDLAKDLEIHKIEPLSEIQKIKYIEE